MDFGATCRIKWVLQFALFFSYMVISLNLFLLYLLPFQLGKKIEYPDDEVLSNSSEFDVFSQQIASCNLFGWTAANSALDRAKTPECKQQIRTAACTLKEKGSLHPTDFRSKCPLVDWKRAGRYYGCYKDEPDGKPMLNTQMFRFGETNTVELCVESCFQVGAVLAGVQHGDECHCGDTIAPGTFHGLYNVFCAKYPCPGDESISCGGDFWTGVYETGFNSEIRNSAHVRYVELTDPIYYGRTHNTSKDGPEPLVRILHFLAISGRNDRQAFRLLRLIYRQQHYYYIHVDKRSDYLYRRIVAATKDGDNIFVTKQRYATFWGGSTQLQGYLLGIKEIMTKTNWKWQYVINYSESDLPLLSIEQLTAFLTRNNGYNFLASQTKPIDEFLGSQAVKKVFLECDEHLWLIGDRKLPSGIWFDGGSTWFVLHRDFVQYIIYGDDDLINGLREMYKYVLLPGETFYHTVLHNSRFCQTYVSRNLKLESWKKGKGCHCAENVDWCGCSPHVWDMSNVDGIDPWKSLHQMQYSARKFDPIVDVEIINFVEKRQLLTDKLPFENHNSVWYNAYCALDRVPKVRQHKLRLMESLARISTRAFLSSSAIKDTIVLDWEREAHNANSSSSTLDSDSSCQCDLHSISPTNQWMYKTRDGEAKAVLVTFNISCGGQIREMECWLDRIPKFRLLGKHPLYQFLVGMEVGMDYNAKEGLFRGDYLGGVGVDQLPTLRQEWKEGDLGKWNSSSVTMDWKDPSGNVMATHVLQLDPTKPIHSHQLKPDNSTPLSYDFRPGTWTVTLLRNRKAIAETKYLVVPKNSSSLNSSLRNQLLTITGLFGTVNNCQQEPGADYGNYDICKIPDLTTDEQLHMFLDGVVRDFYVPKGFCLMDHSSHASPAMSFNPGNNSPDAQQAGFGRGRSRTIPESPNDTCSNLLSTLPLCSYTPWSSAAPDPKSEFKPIRWVLVAP